MIAELTKSDNHANNLRNFYEGKETLLEFNIAGIFDMLKSNPKDSTSMSNDEVERIKRHFKGEKLEIESSDYDDFKVALNMSKNLLNSMIAGGFNKDSSDADLEEPKENLREIMERFTRYLDSTLQALKFHPDKSTQYHKELNEFLGIMSQIDETFSGETDPKVDETFSKYDWKSLKPIFDYKEGLPAGFDESKEETKTAAGKAAEKLLDSTATKALKIAFSKGKNKDSIKEILGEIIEEIPDDGKKFLVQALKELSQEYA